MTKAVDILPTAFNGTRFSPALLQSIETQTRSD
jgi:hypothetical protein